MASYNRVILMGNLTKDPELRNLPSGMAVVAIALAVNRKFRNQQNEMQEEVTFVDCEGFGRTAEVIHQYCKKGDPLHVEGRLKLDRWQDRDGNNRSKLKVIVERFEFISSRGSGGGQGGSYDGGNQHGSYDGGSSYHDNRPPQRSAAPSAPANEPPHESIPEDDIPF